MTEIAREMRRHLSDHRSRKKQNTEVRKCIDAPHLKASVAVHYNTVYGAAFTLGEKASPYLCAFVDPYLSNSTKTRISEIIKVSTRSGEIILPNNVPVPFTCLPENRRLISDGILFSSAVSPLPEYRTWNLRRDLLKNEKVKNIVCTTLRLAIRRLLRHQAVEHHNLWPYIRQEYLDLSKRNSPDNIDRYWWMYSQNVLTEATYTQQTRHLIGYYGFMAGIDALENVSALTNYLYHACAFLSSYQPNSQSELFDADREGSHKHLSMPPTRNNITNENYQQYLVLNINEILEEYSYLEDMRGRDEVNSQ